MRRFDGQNDHPEKGHAKGRFFLLSIWLLASCAVLVPSAVAFDSGSDESDGALILTEPGEYDFFALPLDHGDGTYDFTTVQIDDGVVLALRSATRGPITWLASDVVEIHGSVIASGDTGHGASAQSRAVPGSGGFSGGTGGNSLVAATFGSGPGGGFPGDGSTDEAGSGAGHFMNGFGPSGGYPYGNAFLLPLIGGSGGGGGFYGSSASQTGYGGGAGGGALLIASSTAILVTSTGLVAADGGSSLDSFSSRSGGGGSGGSLRLIAPLIDGSGLIQALGGDGLYDGSVGRIRLEAYENLFSGAVQPPASTGLPGVVSIPADRVPLRITSVGGVAVSPTPTGIYAPPDVVLESAAPVTVIVEGRGIPVGTVVAVTLFTENGENETISTSPLAGTLESSTASADVLIPNGFSGLFAQANWTP